jgi:unsaturated rhamnogalacturonyl hydrolase
MKFTRRVLPNFLPLVAAIGLATALQAAESAPTFRGKSPVEWSVKMADSETARSAGKHNFREGGRARWDYTVGLFTLSLIKLHEQVDKPEYLKFAEQAVGSFIDEKGVIRGYRVEEYNIDHINPGKTVLALYSHTGEERYRLAADLLRSQLNNHPRTSQGGFWHKKRYPHQMWLDGLYMGAPFYAEYSLRFGQLQAFDHVVKQFRLMDAAAYDAKSGLYYHGWDESKEQIWANKTTGTSANFWGRGLGWFAMALVDTLDFLPLNHPGRQEILAILNRVAAGIVRHQDAKTGLWYQVLDQGTRKGNYLEASASSMFVYSLAKAVNRGYLSKEYVPAIQKGYDGIVRDLITEDADGKINLIQCCLVAGLSHDRDGSYEYYLREPIVLNDFKGVGPFILAGIEVERLLNPMGWNHVPRILSMIREPKFPDRDFVITDFGAVKNSETDSTEAIRKAIEACHSAGGGRVVIPAGTWRTGAIHLKSNVNLHVSEGAHVLFSTDPKAYLPVVLTRWEGMDCYNYSALIYAYGQENIAITGKGILDGQSDYSNWWGWVKKSATQKANPSLQRGSRDKLYSQMDACLPASERVYGEGHYLRPNFIQPYRCRNVLIEGVTLHRSPMWEVHPVFCTNVIVRGMTIVTHGPNNDGCDPESSRNVLIENCLFDTGDDCIAIKSGRNNDGRRWLMPSENLIIRNCTMKDGHGGTVIGSEIAGSCRNVFTEDCTMDSPDLDRALRLKTNAVRGGVIENVFMRNVQVGRVADAILTIDFQYEEGERGEHYPLVRNVVMENVTSRSAPRALSLVGYAKSPIKDVTLINCTFSGVEGPDRVVHVEGLDLKNVKIERKQ